MAVGTQQDLGTLNQLSGAIALELEEVITRIEHFKAWLDTQAVADLQTLGMSANDANTLKSAFTDAATLAAVYRGTGTQATTYNFSTFLKLLRGVSYW